MSRARLTKLDLGDAIVTRAGNHNDPTARPRLAYRIDAFAIDDPAAPKRVTATTDWVAHFYDRTGPHGGAGLGGEIIERELLRRLLGLLIESEGGSLIAKWLAMWLGDILAGKPPAWDGRTIDAVLALDAIDAKKAAEAKGIVNLAAERVFRDEPADRGVESKPGKVLRGPWKRPRAAKRQRLVPTAWAVTP